MDTERSERSVTLPPHLYCELRRTSSFGYFFVYILLQMDFVKATLAIILVGSISPLSHYLSSFCHLLKKKIY